MPTPSLRACPAALAAACIATLAATSLEAQRALANDNTVPAGVRRGRTVAVTLEPRAARWSPVADTVLLRDVFAWAEAGGEARVPGPLLRARVGDTLRVTLRNPLGRALAVAGLGDRASGAMPDTVRVAPGATRELVIPLTRAGSFWYDGVTTHPDDRPGPSGPFPDKEEGRDETLVGALVVDEADAPADAAARERVFLIHIAGSDSANSARLVANLVRRGQVPENGLFVNGTSWPDSERLRYAVGDTVRWRVINAAFLPHPMHLHGFYFRVDARGDGRADTAYAARARRMAVTELMEGFTTARLTWVPEREGNWLFHCHLLRHMAPLRPSAANVRRAAAMGVVPDTAAHRAHLAHLVADTAAYAHPRAHMAGLVLGIHVAPRAGARAPATRAPARAARPLALWVTGGARGVGYVLQEGAAPAPDSVRRPGSTIALARGEPVAITIHNTRAEPVAVHWHGMELESRYDGVGGWSGTPASVTPPIAPGDSFTVRFTPPRAGTFIYHTHDESANELAAGLYGALLVHEPGRRPDPSRDQVLVLGAGTQRVGRIDVPHVNADTGGTPVVLAGGALPQRLRLVNIAGSDLKAVRLLDAAGAPLAWRVVGKDGWTPPAHQRAASRPAALLVGVGETYDLELSSDVARRASTLEVETRFYPGAPGSLLHVARFPVRVAEGRTARVR